MFDESATLDIGIEDHVEKIWDVGRLGRIIGGAITEAGYDRMADLVVDMERKTGVRRHENTLYDIKNGKRLPDLELMAALTITLGIKQAKIAEAVTVEFRDQYGLSLS